MDSIKTRTSVLVLVALSLLAWGAGTSAQEVPGTEHQQPAEGVGATATEGMSVRSTDGTGIDSIDGTGTRATVGSGIDSIDGTGVDSIDGTGTQSSVGSDIDSIDGTGIDSIDGTGLSSAQPVFPQTGGTQYLVQVGDTLQSIALAHYGDANKYVVIYEANRTTISNPDSVEAGQTLVLPTLR